MNEFPIWCLAIQFCHSLWLMNILFRLDFFCLSLGCLYFSFTIYIHFSFFFFPERRKKTFILYERFICVFWPVLCSVYCVYIVVRCEWFKANGKPKIHLTIYINSKQRAVMAIASRYAVLQRKWNRNEELRREGKMKWKAT